MEEDNGEEGTPTVASRMILYFYKRMANGGDVWDASFWDAFQAQNPDVGMDSKTLRAYFYGEIMQNADLLEGQDCEVLQYINPLFNRIRSEVLEYRDLAEGVDYVFGEDGMPTDLGPDALPPIQLKSAVPVSSPSHPRATASPGVEQVLQHVADGLREVLWTESERPSRPALDVAECLQRVALLTQNGILLSKCIEPQMSCYDRFRRMGIAEPVGHELEGSEEYEQFHEPQGISTPLHTVRPGQVSTVRKDSAPGQSFPEGETTTGRQTSHTQTSSFYRTPAGAITPNYASLRHVRSKQRRYNT